MGLTPKDVVGGSITALLYINQAPARARARGGIRSVRRASAHPGGIAQQGVFRAYLLTIHLDFTTGKSKKPS